MRLNENAFYWSLARRASGTPHLRSQQLLCCVTRCMCPSVFMTSSSRERNRVSVSAVCFLCVCMFGSCDPELRTIDHDLSFGQRFRGAAADRLCERVSEEDEKSIAFHYVVGRCHWPVNDPVTAAAHG